MRIKLITKYFQLCITYVLIIIFTAHIHIGTSKKNPYWYFTKNLGNLLIHVNFNNNALQLVFFVNAPSLVAS